MSLRERADQQAAHGVERLEDCGVTERVVGLRAAVVTRDEPDSPHDAEMLGNVRLLYSEFAGQLADGPFATPQGVEDAQASRMTDSATELGVELIRLFRDHHELQDILKL